MVFGLATGVGFPLDAIFWFLSSDSGGIIRSSGKGDSILGIRKGFSVDREELFLESVRRGLLADAFFGGEVCGWDAPGFWDGESFDND